ncbi:MAG: cytochrome c3 family protein [Acidobacteria bacterium]|nr:cytochrome c3 family protein [Acidobacteriota bacterium]
MMITLRQNGLSLWILLGSLSLALVLVQGAAAQAKDSCVTCHAMMPDRLTVTPEKFATDIHAQKGLTCVSCHGGDPSKEDAPDAMSAKAGFKAKLRRRDVPQLCAKCHSDGAFMRTFNPSLRTDQHSQYKTSIHGQRLARGDERVAICTDCHGLHEIRAVKDSRSRVHPTNVAKTCSECHASPEHMKGYSIPTDQFASYRASVHHTAIMERGDLSAPTCSTCHGNHGAAPPGVASVENVCATCHVFQAQLFDTSPHKAAFKSLGIGTCITCHSNHRIHKPIDAMLGTGKDAVCTTCHSEGDAGFKKAGDMRTALQQLEDAIEQSTGVLERAERSGMEVSQTKLDQNEAHDALTKARVTIHAFDPGRLQQDISTGLKVADKTLKAGNQALAERDFRRKGLALSLITIALVLAGLRMFVIELERRKNSFKEET